MAVLLDAKLLAWSFSNSIRKDFIRLNDGSFDFSPIMYRDFNSDNSSFIYNGEVPSHVEFINLDRNVAALAALFTEQVCTELVRIMYTPQLWENFNGREFWNETVLKDWTCAKLYRQTLTELQQTEFDTFLTKIDSSFISTRLHDGNAIFDNASTIGNDAYIDDMFFVSIEELEKLNLKSTKVFTIGDCDLIGDCSNLVLDYIGGNDFKLIAVSF